MALFKKIKPAIKSLIFNVFIGNQTLDKDLDKSAPKNTEALENLNNADFVEICYQQIFDCNIARKSKAFYVNKLNAGMSRIEFVSSLFSSQEFKSRKRNKEFVHPGHFYSCIPSLENRALAKRQRTAAAKTLPGIKLNEDAQLLLLELFKDFYRQLPFSSEKNNIHRFYYKNPAYSYADSIFLNCFIRYLKPKNIIEIGSGYSSCMTLDTNELFFENSINCTFIEPYPQLLQSLLKPGDKERIQIIDKPLQNVDLSFFSKLVAGDILFIDSTHVSKAGSDVNQIFFEILPSLNKGVFIHIHDVFYPFEYPDKWLDDGRAWSEQYILRSFLQYNQKFEIRLFSDFIAQFHRNWLQENMANCLKNTGGNIWLEKVAT